MLETPRIARTEARHTAVVRLTVPRSEIQQVMGPAIGEVMAAVMSQGMHPAGPVFSRHFRMTPDVFDFEVGVPVERPVAPAGRVVPGTLPAVRAAQTVYCGPYEGLGAAWGEFQAWMSANGHDAAEDLWESYAAGPESGPDASRWRTELIRPLRGA